MNLCNETITVFNKRQEEDTGYDIYIPTVISGVSWHSEIASSVDAASGLKAANKFTIRIPVDADFSGKQYVTPVAYADSDKDTSFTLRNSDIIVHDAVADQGLTPAVLQAKYGEVVTVLGVTDNRRMPNAKHWKVVGA